MEPKFFFSSVPAPRLKITLNDNFFQNEAYYRHYLQKKKKNKLAPAPHPWKKGMIYKKKHIENNRNIFKVVFEVMAGQSNFHLTAKKNNEECIEIRAEGPFPRPLLFNR